MNNEYCEPVERAEKIENREHVERLTTQKSEMGRTLLRDPPRMTYDGLSYSSPDPAVAALGPPCTSAA